MLNDIPVSIIMLTCNRENLVRRAVESILSQTMPNFEFIIVDNGSEDRSGDICKEYVKQDSRVRLIIRPKGNIGVGRNDGLALSCGRYITFIDDDDVAQPGMMMFLYSLAEEHGADVAICGSWKEINGEILPNFIFDETMIMNGEEAVIDLCERSHFNAATPTKLWKRNLFEGVRFDETGKYDDIAVVYKLVASARNVVLNGQPQYCFYRHTGNNSGFTDKDKMLTPEQLEEYFRVYHERTAYLSAKFPDSKDYFDYSHWSFLISMFHKITLNGLTKCASQREYARAILEENYDTFLNSVYIKDFEKQNLTRYFHKIFHGRSFV